MRTRPWHLWLFVLAGADLAALLCAVPAQAQYFSLGKEDYPLEFYDIDFSGLANPAKRVGPFDALHYIPLGSDPDTYFSLGGEVRQQFWSWNNDGHGLKTPHQNSYDLSRVIADAYLHFNRKFAIFLQLGRYDAIGKDQPLSSADATAGRIQQGFLEFKDTLAAATITARAGRQEIALGSGRFVWVNDSSNIRTTHDGIRVTIDFAPGTTLDLFATQPVTPTPDAFSDVTSHNGSFAGVYAKQALLPSQVLNVDEYYYYRQDIGAQYAGLAGNEERDTVGGRLWGAFGSLKYDSDFAYQFGTFDNKPISAFGTSTRVLYTFEALTWQPGLQLQTSYFSGSNDGLKSQTIGTFSAPFARPTLLNYAGLETLENLIEVYPALVLSPAPTVVFRLGPEVLWRASVYDAVYISRTTALPTTLAANDRARYIGTNLVATAAWHVNANVGVFAEYLHELAGPAITLAGGHGADVGVAQVDFKF